MTFYIGSHTFKQLHYRLKRATFLSFIEQRPSLPQLPRKGRDTFRGRAAMLECDSTLAQPHQAAPSHFNILRSPSALFQGSIPWLLQKSAFLKYSCPELCTIQTRLPSFSRFLRQAMPAKPKATPSTTRITKSKRKNNKESALATQINPAKRTSARLASALESTAPVLSINPAQEKSTMSSNTTQNATSSTEQKKKDGPVYFWQPHQGHGYLGQWFPTPFEVDGETYATAEMWMMVQKARLFEDEVRSP